MTVKVLKIDNDGKVVRENGDFVWLYDNDAVTQLIKQKISVFRNEWFMNLNLGVDYFNVIFPKTSSDFKRYLEFKTVVESVPGVISLLSAEITPVDVTNRSWKVILRVKGDYGIINFNEVINNE